MSNTVPQISTLDLLIAISKTILNIKGVIPSLCPRAFLTLHLEDKCLLILTLACISLLKVLHNFTHFWSKLVYVFHSFPFSIQCYTLLENKQINR